MSNTPPAEWNRTDADYPRDRCLHELFEQQARLTPDRIAVAGPSASLSYRELNERSNLLAAELQRLGVGPDVLVGICVSRSPSMIVAVYATLKAGGAYVPLDATLPEDRLSFMVQDAAIAVLITEQSLDASLSIPGVNRVLVDAAPSRPMESFVKPLVSPGNLAYVRYTSGSTGKPKGVQIEHRSIVNFIESMRRLPGLTPDDTLLAVTTLSFDISELEIHLPLTTGAKVVLASQEMSSSGGALQAAIAEHKVTMMQATPATWRLLLDAGWTGAANFKALCGGEALATDLARQLLPKCSELWNMYGPTETTVWSTCCRITSDSDTSIGRPIANTTIHIVDTDLHPVAIGSEGELLIGGDGVARGYLNRPELTAEKFIADPGNPGRKLYRTGDLARYHADGRIECLGRLDFQIKVNGFRIEPGEIEAVLAEHPKVRQAVVVAREDTPGDKRLVAYFTSRDSGVAEPAELRQRAQHHLPAYMVPAFFVPLDKIPLNANGKVDRKALPRPSAKRPQLARDYVAPSSQLESQLANIWSQLLGLAPIGIDDSFFELGGTSLLAVRFASLWHSQTGQDLSVVKIFQYPTIGALARWMEVGRDSSDVIAQQDHRSARLRRSGKPEQRQTPIAIIGMAGRFPGAEDIDELWRNLCAEKESITVFSREELGIGIDESLRHDPDYIPARGIIKDAELFDAAFFGIGSLEASVMDPQQRVFLELAYTALENAGYDPERSPGPIGVYAGVGDNRYYSLNLLGHPKLLARAGRLAVEYGNEKDYVALRVAYALNLTGPAVSANTACSTTLLTIDQAVRGLADHECDIALAGGIDIGIPQKSGFFYEEGGTFSRDGHCRPFDADATGTMFCDGAGIVVLRRLDDALADGDTIYAVITGTAKNNNGARTASFLAPSVEGQAEVIAMAQANANVPVETIGYIEAHGTGTPVGDPIEIEALNKVFSAKTQKRQFCHVGSIKGNIGHPTNAAGVAGMIKAALVLHNELIPPTLHFRRPNPRIDFENGCFRVADKLLAFPRTDVPRRAAVSSFGFGGTNVHAILEEAPVRNDSGPSLPVQLLVVSARTPAALEAYAQRLAAHFERADGQAFADAAFTLSRGRKQWPHRRFVVATDRAEAVTLLRQPHPLKSGSAHCIRRNPPVVFLFGGQGTQYVNMGQDLYRTEPLFRAVVDECCELLKPHLGRDLRTLLYPAAGDEEAARESLRNTLYTQPAIFTIEYSLARWWQSIGVEPATMVGHSIGEFAAATIAGVFELADVLRIVAARGRLMQSMSPGSMLSVRAAATEVETLLPPGVQLAAINSPTLCVVAGPDDRVELARKTFEGYGWVCKELLTSHAFHSEMMDPMLERLRAEFCTIKLRAPSKPLMSTVTGAPMTAEQACDPGYWARQARMTVRFSTAIRHLLDQGESLFLECGPRATLSTLTRQHAGAAKKVVTIASLGDASGTNAEVYSLLAAAGSLWLQGISIDWDALYANESRRRVPLPTYPFERQRYWVDPATPNLTVGGAHEAPADTSRSALPPSASDNISAEPAKKGEIATRLTEIISQISGGEMATIDSKATFFELGLDSLALVQVTSAIRNELGVKVSFGQLTNQFPNIELLAGHLEQASPTNVLRAPSASPPSQKAKVEPTAVTQDHPPGADLRTLVEEQGRMLRRITDVIERAGLLTASPSASATVTQEKEARAVTWETTVPQLGIYVSSRLSERLSASYNESITITLEGRIDTRSIRQAIQQLCERHDALRASFDETGRTMRFAPDAPGEIELVDLSTAEPLARTAGLEAVIKKEGAKPFSLPLGPLFRSVIVSLDSTHAAVVLTAHHVICDGWGMDVLVHDFCACYSAALGGNVKPLQPVTSYGRYLEMCAARTKSADFSAARAYCEAKFREGFPVLVLPTRTARSATRTFEARREEIIVPAATVKILRDYAAREGHGFFSVVLAGYVLMLAKVSRQQRFTIALPTAEQPGLGQPYLVGHCVNMLPFLGDTAPGQTVREFVAGIQSQLTESYDHSTYTLTHLLDRLRPTVQHTGIRPISVGLTSVKKWKSSELPQSGFIVDYDMNPREYESFEFYLVALERADDLVLRCSFDQSLFEQSTVSTWMTDLARVIAVIPAQNETRIGELLKGAAATCSPANEVRYALTEVTSPAEPIDDTTGRTAAAVSRGISLDRMIVLWERVLGIHPIGPDDNFFDLGGHSLLAVSMAARVQKTFGVKFPLSALLKAPTPRQCIEQLTGGSKAHTQLLVPIVPGGSKPALFLFHSHGGNVLEYYRLATLVGKDRPVYALQCQGVDGTPLVLTTVEEMAKTYIAEIRTVQPNGPYHLGGYCFGGVLAVEAARQLRAAGLQVGSVVMINSATAEHVARKRSLLPPARGAIRVAERLSLEYSKLTGIPWSEKFRQVQSRVQRSWQLAGVHARRGFARLIRPFGMQLSHVSTTDHLEQLGDNNDAAWYRYTPQRYDGDVLFFRACKQSRTSVDDPLLGWSAVLNGRISHVDAPGFRQNLLSEPVVTQIADKIRTHLADPADERNGCSAT